MAEEEGEQEGADGEPSTSASVIEDDFVRSAARRGRSRPCRCRAHGGDHGPNFFVAQILSWRAFSTFRILPFSGRIAWNLAVAALLGGAAGGLALDQIELAAIRLAFASSPRACPAGPAVQRAFAARQSRALRAASRARAASIALLMIRLAIGRVLFEEQAQPVRRRRPARCPRCRN